MYPKLRRYLIHPTYSPNVVSPVDKFQGPRVTDQILRLVPNVNVFRDALRCIKLWAARTNLELVLSAFPIYSSCHRTGDLLQRERIPRWCGLVYARCAHMPVISQCCRWRDRQSIFYHHVSMVCIKFSTLGIISHSHQGMATTRTS
jgi:hypothetical protein